MFCVKCGKENIETINGLCAECFLDGRKPISLPHYVDLEMCTSCEEFKIDNAWVNREKETAIEDAAISGLAAIPEVRILSVGAQTTEQDPRNYFVKVDVEADMNGYVTVSEAETTVRLKNTVCQKCSRQLGNYYESTLQIRSGTKELSDDLRDETVRYVRDRVEHMSKTSRQIFITKVQEVQGGVDLLLSSISLGRAMAKELSDSYGAETKEAFKLVGRNSDGSDMYRMTYLVRMPEYHVGDVISYKDKPYKLLSISKNNGRLMTLNDFRETSIRRNEMEDIRVIQKHCDLKETTVVSRGNGEIQILHPSNFSTIDVKIPHGSDIGETVKVVDIDDVIMYVP